MNLRRRARGARSLCYLRHLFCLCVFAAATLPAKAQDVAEMAARMDAMQRQMQVMQRELAILRQQSGDHRTVPAAKALGRRVSSREDGQLSERTEHQQRVAQAGGPGGAPPAAVQSTPIILGNDLICNLGSYALGPAI